MPFIPTPLCVSAEIRMICHGQKIENTLSFLHPNGWTPATAQDLANHLLTWWTTLYRVPVSSDVTLREIVVTDISTQNSFQVTQPAPAPAPQGAVNIGAAPNNVSLTYSFRTTKIGRSFRGRNYVVGIPREHIVDDIVGTVYTNAMQSAYDTLAFSVLPVNATWVVVSKFNNKAPRAQGVATEIVRVVLVDNVVDSQRRRLTGRGQ